MGYTLWQRVPLHTGTVFTRSMDTSCGSARHYIQVQYLPGHGIHLVAARNITYRYSTYLVMRYILWQRESLHTGTVSTWSWDTSCGSDCHYIQVQYLPSHGIHLVAASAITYRHSIYLVIGYILWQRMPLHTRTVISGIGIYIMWHT